MLTFRHAVRNVFRHKLRSSVTLAAISVGCVAIIFAGGFFDDLYVKLRSVQINTQTGHIQIFKKGYFDSEATDPYGLLIENPKKISELIEKVPGVVFVAPRLPFSGLLSNGESAVSFQGIGLDVGKEPAAKSAGPLSLESKTVLVSGDPLDAQSPASVLLGQGLAETFNIPPDQQMIILNRTVDGSFNGQDVHINGIFVTGMKEVDDYALQLPIATAQKLLRTEAVQSFIVKVNQTKDTNAVKAKLLDLFQKEGLDLELKTWDELSDFSVKTEALFGRFYFVLKVIIVFVVVFSIYNTLNMSVLERTTEIGTVMTMGFGRLRVIQLFLAEGIALGLVGGVVGSVLGMLFTLAAGTIGIVMPASPGLSMSWLLEPQVTWANVSYAFFLSLICSFVSAFLPAFRASKLEIAQALRSTN